MQLFLLTITMNVVVIGAMRKLTPLERAVAVAGTQTRLAQMTGISQQRISYWIKNRGKPVPAEIAAKASDATGIPRSDFRPDIFGEVAQ